MARTDVSIPTRDGVCPASVFRPDGAEGALPAVVLFMDGLGIRPVLWEMSQHLADGGYLVLLPDLYYRSGPYPPMVPAAVLADPLQREVLMGLVKSLDRDRKVSDVEAFLAYLATRPDVAGERYGVLGYCMGGNIALYAGGAVPERVAAIASFHGGDLATEESDSPHLNAPKFEGRVYVAAAVEDASFPEEQRARLERALDEAHVAHRIETYAGAHHGFAIADHPAYDAAATERHWTALFTLLAETIGRQG